mmetsp:Transcript_19289/g.55519  ORF Transcript_19289/g.55519 Transcript_19289/m.55519 type:complete len:101 (-) Transcript_19289:1023-1325(-)
MGFILVQDIYLNSTFPSGGAVTPEMMFIAHPPMRCQRIENRGINMLVMGHPTSQTQGKVPHANREAMLLPHFTNIQDFRNRSAATILRTKHCAFFFIRNI